MPSRADYERFFREADTDNSGELTFDEMYKMLQKKGFRGPKSEIQRYFANCDTSGDKKLSMNEYLVAMGQIPPDESKEAVMRSVFVEFDKSEDGHLDKEEVRAILADLRRSNEVTEDEAKRALAQMDSDGDGRIDYEEFLAFFFNKKK